MMVCLSFVVRAELDYPIVERNGKDYYEYTIQKGDGLYAIGKKFKVSQKELFDANPGLTENIREGAKLYVPVKQKRKDRGAAQTIHIVEDKQTPYSIARMYNMPLDTLIRYNPGIRNGIIHTGDTLIISYQKAIAAKEEVVKRESSTVVEIPETIVVREKETLYSISKTYNVPMSTLLTLNPSAEDGLKKGQTLRLRPAKEGEAPQDSAAVRPREAKPEQARQAVADANALKIAYILPFTNEKTTEANFIEFYRGSLIALDRARTDNAINRDIEVWAWDTRGKKEVLDSILALDALKKVDVIIGPGFTHELEAVLRYAKNHGKKIVVPFSSHIEKGLYFEKLYQFNPPQDWWWNIAIRKELNEHPAERYLIGHTGNSKKGKALANKLKSILQELHKTCYELDMTESNADSLVKANARGNTVLLLANNSGVEVRPLVDNIAASYHSNVTVWGFGKWGTTVRRFAPTMYYSLFYDQATEAYENKYISFFKHRAVHSDIRFDLLGYDITTFVVNKNGTYMQSDVNFVKIDGRWVNNKIYRVNWNGYTLSVE